MTYHEFARFALTTKEELKNYDGWTLLEVVHESWAQEVTNQVPDPQYSSTLLSVKGHIQATSSFFLMGLKEDNVCADLRRELDDKKADLENVTKGLDQIKTDFDKMEQERDEQAETIERLHEVEREKLQTISDLRNQINSYEQTLAHARLHFGEAAWKEMGEG